jgi:hypothetical protein
LWRHEADWEAAHQVEVLLIFDHDGQVGSRRYVLVYRPIRYPELLACLEEVGCEIEARRPLA